jgi:hypothetical protein
MKKLFLLALAGLALAGCSTYYHGYGAGGTGGSYQTGANSGGTAGFETIAPNRAPPALPGNSTSGSFPVPVIPLTGGSPRP